MSDRYYIMSFTTTMIRYLVHVREDTQNQTRTVAVLHIDSPAVCAVLHPDKTIGSVVCTVLPMTQSSLAFSFHLNCCTAHATICIVRRVLYNCIYVAHIEGRSERQINLDLLMALEVLRIVTCFHISNVCRVRT